jgi:hypothetical protein
VGKYQGRKSFGRPKYRLEDNIKMDIKEVGLVMDQVHQVQVGVQ